MVHSTSTMNTNKLDNNRMVTCSSCANPKKQQRHHQQYSYHHHYHHHYHRRRRRGYYYYKLFLFCLVLESALSWSRSSRSPPSTTPTTPTAAVMKAKEKEKATASTPTTTTTKAAKTTTTTTMETKIKGTRMTGVGSKSKKNQSIFLTPSTLTSSTLTLSTKASANQQQQQIYAKVTKDNELLLYFPPQVDDDDDNDDDDDDNDMEDNLGLHVGYNTCTTRSSFDFDTNTNTNTDEEEQVVETKPTTTKPTTTKGTTKGTIISLSTKFKNIDEQMNYYSIHAEVWNNASSSGSMSSAGTSTSTSTATGTMKEKKSKDAKKNKKKKARNTQQQNNNYSSKYSYLSSLLLNSNHDEHQNHHYHYQQGYEREEGLVQKQRRQRQRRRHFFSKQQPQQWIPIEGIYGIYNLPSGPHLILITESELIYQSPDANDSDGDSDADGDADGDADTELSSVNNKIDTVSNKRQEEQTKTPPPPPSSSSSSSSSFQPLLHLRKIKSMEMIPLPIYHQQQQQEKKQHQQQQHQIQNQEEEEEEHNNNTNLVNYYIHRQQRLMKAERNQLNLLRQSLKEHEFYYTVPTLQMQKQIQKQKQKQMQLEQSCQYEEDENNINYYEEETINNNRSNNVIIPDVTQSLQRCFLHWSTSKKEVLERNESQKKRIVQNYRLFSFTTYPTTQFTFRYDSSKENNIQNVVMNDNDSKKDDQWNDVDSNNNEGQTFPIQFQLHSGILRFLSNLQERQEEKGTVSNLFGFDIVQSILESIAKMKKEKEKENDMVVANGKMALDWKRMLSYSWWRPLLDSVTLNTLCGDYCSSESKGNLVLRPDTRFFWNEECIHPIIHQLSGIINNHSKKRKNGDGEIDDALIIPYYLLLQNTIPVTSAFVGVQKGIELIPESSSGKLPSIKYDQLLISRRSKFRAGTRFTKRGADGVGDVANFAETEQICIVLNDESKNIDSAQRSGRKECCLELYSHVQTRGSIPLRWSSPTDIKTYRPKVLIGTDPIAQARALRSHLLEQLSIYSFVPSLPRKDTKLVFVNLIDKHSDQGRLGRTFSSVLDAVLTLYGNKSYQQENHPCVQSLSPDFVSHLWFDFHAECRKGRWHRLQNLLDDVAPVLDSQRYFHATAQCMKETMKWSIHQIQDGVVRTNCMDCLDRTNVVQSMFGRYMLYKQFSERYEPRIAGKRRLPLEYIIGYKKDMLKLPWKKGEMSHRLLWADNADCISRLYAGTPALKGDFTRTGKRTKRGALDDGLNSVTRFYLNNFLDADRQKGMDLLTGFTKFEMNFDDRDITRMKMANEDRIPFNKKMRNGVSHEFKSKAPNLNESKLNLGWLPGDLESHLRSAALTAQHSQLEVENSNSVQTTSFSSAEALKDIGRRASIENPWWVDESDGNISDTKESPKVVPTTPSAGGGHVVGALVALNQAPIATVVTILFLLLPGISSQ